MGTDAREAEFLSLLKQLEDWYSDYVRARAYDAPSSRSIDDGEEFRGIMLRQRYPGPNWRQRWREADAHARDDIIRAIEEELYGLAHGPSQAGPASGLHRGTAEWRLAVASADGSLRAVARRFGVSHTEVRRLRLRLRLQHAADQ